MSSLSDKIQDILVIKGNIKNSIENKGINVGDASFYEYPKKIDSIVASGGGLSINNTHKFPVILSNDMNNGDLAVVRPARTFPQGGVSKNLLYINGFYLRDIDFSSQNIRMIYSNGTANTRQAFVGRYDPILDTYVSIGMITETHGNAAWGSIYGNSISRSGNYITLSIRNYTSYWHRRYSVTNTALTLVTNTSSNFWSWRNRCTVWTKNDIYQFASTNASTLSISYWKRTGTTFNALTSLITHGLSGTDQIRCISISDKDDFIIAGVTNATHPITIFRNNGDESWTRLPSMLNFLSHTPGTTPSGSSLANIWWSEDDEFLCIYRSVYRKVGFESYLRIGTFTRTITGISPDGEWLTTVGVAPWYLELYRLDGDTYVQQAPLVNHFNGSIREDITPFVGDGSRILAAQIEFQPSSYLKSLSAEEFSEGMVAQKLNNTLGSVKNINDSRHIGVIGQDGVKNDLVDFTSFFRVSNSYKITYFFNGGTANVSTIYQFDQPSQLPIPLYPPSRTGFSFQGWYDTPDFTEDIYAHITELKGAYQFWAKWVLEE